MNKLRDVFCHDKDVAERAIKKIVNQAYDMQWCTACKHSYFLEGNQDILIKCQISEKLCEERRWSNTDSSEQYCLFYEAKNRGE